MGHVEARFSLHQRHPHEGSLSVLSQGVGYQKHIMSKPRLRSEGELASRRGGRVTQLEGWVIVERAMVAGGCEVPQ